MTTKRKFQMLLMIMWVALPARSQVLPHIAVGGSYTTDFLVLNTGTTAASVRLEFFDDNGKAMSINFPALNMTATGLHTANPIPAGGSVFIEAADPTGPTRGGSALITGDAGIVVHATFRSRAPDGNFYEASVPSTRGSTRFTVPFDATTFQPTGGQIYTGIAVVNLDSAKPATVTCLARDSSGLVIPNAVKVPTLQPLGHWADYNFPALIGKRGLLDCTSGATVGAIGLRFLGSYAFSSLPVVESMAPAAPPSSAAWILGTWVSLGPTYLMFYADGRIENVVTLGSVTLPTRKGTYQIGQNTVLVNWSPWVGDPAVQETINVVANGSVTTLVRVFPDISVVYTHQ